MTIFMPHFMINVLFRSVFNVATLFADMRHHLRIRDIIGEYVTLLVHVRHYLHIRDIIDFATLNTAYIVQQLRRMELEIEIGCAVEILLCFSAPFCFNIEK